MGCSRNDNLSVADLDRLQPSLQTDSVRLQKGRVRGQSGLYKCLVGLRAPTL